MQKTKNKANKGFTLVELIVVIGIIGILAVVAIVAFGGIQASAQRAVIQATANQVVAQLNLFNNQATDDLRVEGATNNAALGDGLSAPADLSDPDPANHTPAIRTGLSATQIDNGILFIIHPTGGAFDVNVFADGRPFINAYGNVLMELGIEPVGNLNLSTQISEVILWREALGRWEVDATILASMPN